MSGKILVVDDEEIIRESLSFILRKEGYEVDEAENGRVAQSKLLEGKYDIVVTDLEMPQMRGIELLEEIKKLDIHTSIIIITAFSFFFSNFCCFCFCFVSVHKNKCFAINFSFFLTHNKNYLIVNKKLLVAPVLLFILRIRFFRKRNFLLRYNTSF